MGKTTAGGTPADKAGWRRRVAASRRQRSQGGPPSPDGLTAQLKSLVESLRPSSVAAFYPMASEPDVRAFIDELDWVLAPRLYGADGAPLPAGSWGRHRRGDLWEEPHGHHFRQPATPADSDAVYEADLLLVPALAVDRSGTRLGRGGGWYDRVLARRRPEQAVYAVVFEDEVLEAGTLPAHGHDQPVDGAVTESRIIVFDGP